MAWNYTCTLSWHLWGRTSFVLTFLTYAIIDLSLLLLQRPLKGAELNWPELSTSCERQAHTGSNYQRAVINGGPLLALQDHYWLRKEVPPWFRLSWNGQAALPLAAHKPLTYTYLINYSCPNGSDRYDSQSAEEEEVTANTEAPFTNPGHASFLAFASGLLFCTSAVPLTGTGNNTPQAGHTSSAKKKKTDRANVFSSLTEVNL